MKGRRRCSNCVKSPWYEIIPSSSDTVGGEPRPISRDITTRQLSGTRELHGEERTRQKATQRCKSWGQSEDQFCS